MEYMTKGSKGRMENNTFFSLWSSPCLYGRAPKPKTDSLFFFKF